MLSLSGPLRRPLEPKESHAVCLVDATGRRREVRRIAHTAEAVETCLANGMSLSEALDRAREAADEGRDKTVPMLARKGRASYLGERSVGHQDPGATSVALLVAAAAETLS